ncbi:radical SAM protein [Acidaminobacter sp. JC074]|uniref:radical SAM protein n=1 Tax=Acidaminobacter sp. JC074 TaxID=2530199 RepID=UPI001F10ABD4|nr:radical SAM protein [Acidaminobacter sp. JC074]MCH4890200.1 radical SAM protein [Acidaminobacter sp. JC074]
MKKYNQLEIYHIESMGTLDGPGVRTVFFLQGCPLRCDYCHNPDSWLQGKGQWWTFDDLFEMVKKNQPYFARTGGVTFSGGEPLMQSENLLAFIKMLKKENIHVTIDTSGYKLDEITMKVLRSCDLVILDIKAFDDESYKEISKMSLFKPLKTLEFLRENKIKHWIRHVKLPNRPFKLEFLESLANHPMCEKYEVLKYHSMGQDKWQPWQNVFKKNYRVG